MTRSRSMLWLSLALLLFAAGLLVPDLAFDRTAPRRPTYTVRPATPGSSSSASLIDRAGSDASSASPAGDDAPQRLDVRGNEISRPVARYRVDGSGSLYEVHSPETEVPRLKQPVL